MGLRKLFCPLCRINSTLFVSSRHVITEGTRPRAKKEPKYKPSSPAAEVLTFLESTNYDNIRGHLSSYLLKKYRTPQTMYLIDTSTAKHIVSIVGTKIHKDDVLVEVNPGIGVLTKELLSAYENQLHLFEMSPTYTTFLQELQSKYPERVKHKIADFFGMWKLAFQDKLDGGNRIKLLLGDLCDRRDDQVMKVFGAMPTLSFLRHLMYMILFHNTTNSLGLHELYLAISSYNLSYLRDDGKLLQRKSFRPTPALFQLLFDCEVLDKVERAHFLPWQHTISKAALVESDRMYIVKIVQKERLPCKKEYLPLLWYFLRPQIVNKSQRVIPYLEQWVPGAGVWLITGQDPPDTDASLGPDPHDAALPHMTIFTQFGDLSLHQKVTVFKRFISWPEFEQCPFRVNMENNLPRSLGGLDDKDSPASEEAGDEDDERQEPPAASAAA